MLAGAQGSSSNGGGAAGFAVNTQGRENKSDFELLYRLPGQKKDRFERVTWRQARPLCAGLLGGAGDQSQHH